MLVTFIILVIVAVVIAVVFRKLAKAKERIEGLCDESLKNSSGEVKEESQIAVKVVLDTRKDVDKRREKFALLRNELSVEEARKQMGVSPSTAKRYETWRKNNKK